MKIFRIAAMFKTFGLEDKLVKSFMQHHKKLLSAMKDPKVRRKYQRQYFKDKEIHIGSANISDFLAPIIEHYGEPKFMPRRVKFIIARPDHPINKGGDASAFFALGEDGSCSIIKVALNFENIDFDFSFENTIAHETQHFLKSLYYGSLPDYHAAEGGWQIPEYYGDEWEIQAYAMNIARGAIDSIRTVFFAGMENKTPERREKIKASMSNNRMNLASSFLVKSVNKFFEDVEEQTKEEFTPELRKQYYREAFRDFNSMFEEMLTSF